MDVDLKLLVAMAVHMQAIKRLPQFLEDFHLSLDHLILGEDQTAIFLQHRLGQQLFELEVVAALLEHLLELLKEPPVYP
jgi:hypothetical protein